MKAVVLARGVGRRMQVSGDPVTLTAPQRSAADAGAKGMMPIGTGDAGGARPFLDYVLGALADAGVRDVCLVVAPECHEVRRYYDGPGRPARLQLSYAVQPVADGTARAVAAAERFADRDPFLVLNADNIYPVEVLRELIALEGPGLPAFARDSLVIDSGFPAERVAAFALIDVAGDYLVRIIEKPTPERLLAAGPDSLVSMNVWRFDTTIFAACRDVPLSVRGEYELPEAVGLALARGARFRAIPARGAVIDLSHRSDIAAVTRRLAGLEPRP